MKNKQVAYVLLEVETELRRLDNLNLIGKYAFENMRNTLDRLRKNQLKTEENENAT